MRGAAVLVALLAVRPAFALDARYAVTQYSRMAWTEREGIIKAGSLQIAQTTDGYIWVAGESGVMRFDGVRFTPWTRPDHLPIGVVERLLAAPDGSLWFGTLAKDDTKVRGGVFRWRNGTLTDYAIRNPSLGGRVISLARDHTGTVWVGFQDGSLCRISVADDVSCRRLPHNVPGRGGDRPLALHEDRAGTMWIGGEYIYRWDGTNLIEIAQPHRHLPNTAVLCFVDDGDGLLLCTPDGLSRLAGDAIAPYPLAGVESLVWAYDGLRDSDGALWIATTNRGLLHVGVRGVDAFSARDGLPSDIAERLLEDREGNIWVTTEGGVIRFRETRVVTWSTREGLPTNDMHTLVSGRDGEVWTSAVSNTMTRVSRSAVTVFRPGATLPAGAAGELATDPTGRVWTVGEVLFYMDGDAARVIHVQGAAIDRYAHLAVPAADTVWVQQGRDAVVELRVHDRQASKVAARTFPGRTIAALTADDNTDLWVGFYEGGIAQWHAGQWREWDARAFPGRTIALRPEHGAVWLGSSNALWRIEGGRTAKMTAANGLPCGVLRDEIRDQDDNLWVASECGLLRISRDEIDRWWINPSAAVHPRVFDLLDGFPARSVSAGASQRSARTTDGRLWFVLDGPGLAVVDTHRLRDNSVPPPVVIEGLSADDVLQPGARPAVPPQSRNVTIQYTALSYTLPERVRFRYRLDGFDDQWHEATNVRQVSYTNLRPRAYRFQVMAANNDGLWNPIPATLQFSIRPAWYQTTMFGIALMVTTAIGGWTLYRVRLHSQLRRAQRSFEDRLNERTRIAQQLHDTLIQDLTGVSLRAELADDQLPGEPLPAKRTLAMVRADLAKVIADGRAAMLTLRFSSPSPESLPEALAAAARDVPASDHRPEVEVLTVGQALPLRQEARDELYRIGREAIANAIRHSHCRHIAVTLTYDLRELSLVVKDDGDGIDPGVIERGRPGHFGLSGMHERAARIEGVLEINSRRGLGTEVSVTVPIRLVINHGVMPS